MEIARVATQFTAEADRFMVASRVCADFAYEAPEFRFRGLSEGMRKAAFRLKEFTENE